MRTYRLFYAVLTILIQTLECMIALIAIYFLEAGAEMMLGKPLHWRILHTLDFFIVTALVTFVIRAVATQIKLFR